jgi:hypothetical protein
MNFMLYLFRVFVIEFLSIATKCSDLIGFANNRALQENEIKKH